VLIARGFIVHFPDQRTYGLGVAAFEVGSAYLRHEPLEMLARPVLGASSRRWGRPHLGVLHGAETLLLKEQPAVTRIPVTLVTDVGVRLPPS
jgi:DNA-binding IclR family transcriptional regulator